MGNTVPRQRNSSNNNMEHDESDEQFLGMDDDDADNDYDQDDEQNVLTENSLVLILRQLIER